MIGCLRTRVRNQPIIVLYFEFEIKLKFYSLEAMKHNNNLLIYKSLWQSIFDRKCTSLKSINGGFTQFMSQNLLATSQKEFFNIIANAII